MHQKQKKIPERVGAEDTGRTGRRLSGYRVNNPVTVIRPDGELLKAKSTKATLRGLTGICQSLFYFIGKCVL